MIKSSADAQLYNSEAIICKKLYLPIGENPFLYVTQSRDWTYSFIFRGSHLQLYSLPRIHIGPSSPLGGKLSTTAPWASYVTQAEDQKKKKNALQIFQATSLLACHIT